MTRRGMIWLVWQPVESEKLWFVAAVRKGVVTKHTLAASTSAQGRRLADWMSSTGLL